MDELTGDPMTAAAPCNGAGGEVVDAVLHEVAGLLDALARDPGFSDAIDLHSLPMTDDDRARLRQRLGRGEVEAALELAGPVRLAETAFAGVWWVRHADAQDHALLEQIVVARVPTLLLAHPDDIADAARRLAAALCAPPEETLHA